MAVEKELIQEVEQMKTATEATTTKAGMGIGVKIALGIAAVVITGAVAFGCIALANHLQNLSLSILDEQHLDSSNIDEQSARNRKYLIKKETYVPSNGCYSTMEYEYEFNKDGDATKMTQMKGDETIAVEIYEYETTKEGRVVKGYTTVGQLTSTNYYDKNNNCYKTEIYERGRLLNALEYDQFGNLVKFYSFVVGNMEYTYELDDDGRPKKRFLNGNEDADYSYDDAKNSVTMQHTDGQTTIEIYDEDGYLLEEKTEKDGTIISHTIYTYATMEEILNPKTEQTETVVEKVTEKTEKENTSKEEKKTTTNKKKQPSSKKTGTSDIPPIEDLDFNYTNAEAGTTGYFYNPNAYQQYKKAYKTGDTSQLSDLEKKTFKNLKKCVDNAKKYKKKYQQEKAVFDWIILNTAYDYENYKKGTIPMVSYFVEGVFAKKTAVCNGYAESMKLCMDLLGIECKIITTSKHAWNVVKLDDGCWYHVDATWGDPVPNKKNYISYRYFNITDKQMKIEHTFTSDVTCKATKYNYTNAFLKRTYVTSTDAFYKEIAKKIKAGKTSFYISANGINYAEIRNAKRLKKLVGKAVAYTVNKVDYSETKKGITYTDEGRDTHFLITIYTDKTGAIVEAVESMKAFKKELLKRFEEGADNTVIYIMDSKYSDETYPLKEMKKVLPFYGYTYITSDKVGEDFFKMEISFARLGTEETRAKNKEELFQLAQKFIQSDEEVITLALPLSVFKSISEEDWNRELNAISEECIGKGVWTFFEYGQGFQFENAATIRLTKQR